MKIKKQTCTKKAIAIESNENKGEKRIKDKI